MRGLDGIEKYPAKLLHIVLLKCLFLSPLKTLQKIFCLRRSILSLQVDEEPLQLERNAVLFANLFRIMTEILMKLHIAIYVLPKLVGHEKSLNKRV